MRRLSMSSLQQDIARNPSVFGKLLRREADVTVLYEDEVYFSFRNIKKYAPLAALIIPKRFVQQDPDNADRELLKGLKEIALRVLEIHHPEALNRGDYLLRLHRPPFSTVSHLHLHCLAPASQLPIWTRFAFYKHSPWAVDLDSLLAR